MIALSRQLKRWLKYIAILLVVFVLCWQNSTDSENVTNTTVGLVQKISVLLGKDLEYSTNLYYLVRKIGHGLVFAILAYAGHLAINSSATTIKASVLTSLIMSIFIAVMAEFMQAYTFSRSASFTDASINVAGTIVGILMGILTEWISKVITAKKAETV